MAKCSLEMFLNNYLSPDGNKVWDEWSFYSEFIDFDKCAKQLLKLLLEEVNRSDIDLIVGLSKSGLPLASWMAIELKKPLVPFSIGEFFSPVGETLIGFPEFPESVGFELEKKNILLFDSHVVSGETHRLFLKISKTYSINILRFGVIADCSDDERRPEIRNLVAYKNNKIVKQMIENKVKEQFYNDPYFWKHSREHWLVPPQEIDFDEIDAKNSYEVKNINEILINQARNRLIVETEGEEYFHPLLLYIDYDLFWKTISAAANIFKPEHIDTVVACSLGAIPLSIGLCKLLSTSNSKIKFIFLGNGDANYYNKKFEDSRKILFCDDILSTGALVYRAFRQFVTSNKKLSGIFVMMHQKDYPFRDFKCYLPEDVSIYTII